MNSFLLVSEVSWPPRIARKSFALLRSSQNFSQILEISSKVPALLVSSMNFSLVFRPFQDFLDCSENSPNITNVPSNYRKLSEYLKQFLNVWEILWISHKITICIDRKFLKLQESLMNFCIVPYTSLEFPWNFNWSSQIFLGYRGHIRKFVHESHGTHFWTLHNHVQTTSEDDIYPTNSE